MKRNSQSVDVSVDSRGTTETRKNRKKQKDHDKGEGSPEGGLAGYKQYKEGDGKNEGVEYRRRGREGE